MTTAYLKAALNADGTRHTAWPDGDMPYELPEIIAPYDGLANPERNRYYVNYTGLDYVVPVVTYGGRLPFTYTLPTKPTGMTIDSTTGVITWPGANVSAGTHNVTCTVTDAVGNTDSVSWTITVGTTGHIFLDASVGSSGTGTLASPLKGLADVYKASYSDTTFQYKFLWIRSGTYLINDLAAFFDATGSLAWGVNKPQQWIAYPGDTQPEVDCTTGHFEFSSGKAPFVSGIKLKNFLFNNGTTVASRGLQISSSCADVVVYNCTFDYNNGAVAASTNPAPLFFSGAGTAYRFGVMDCTFSRLTSNGAIGSYGLLGYDSHKVVVQRGTFTDFGAGSHPIGPKENCKQWCIRQNTITGTDGLGIWFYGATASPPFTSDYVLIEHNNIKLTTGYGVNLGESANMIYGRFVVRRNTIWGGCGMYIEKLATGQGPVWVADNVLQFPSVTFSTPNPATGDYRDSGNLVVTAADAAVDSSGNLQGAYTRYLGKIGHGFA